MLFSSSVHVQPGPTLLALLMLTAVAAMLGRFLMPAGLLAQNVWLRLACELMGGALFLSASVSLAALGRPTYLLMMPAALLVGRWICVRKAGSEAAESIPNWGKAEVIGVALAALGCWAFVLWMHSWEGADGGLRPLHSDLGYWAQLMTALPHAGLLNSWSIGLGAAAKQAGCEDVWYHWNPILLGVAVKYVTGLSGAAAFLHVVEAFSTFAVLLASAGVGQVLLGKKLPPVLLLLVAACSLMGSQMLHMGALSLWGQWLPFGDAQHLKYVLATNSSYKFEVALWFLAIGAWITDQRRWTLIFLVVSGMSSAQSVACLGITAGMFGGVGLLMRRKAWVVEAAWGCAAMLTAWALVRWVGGLGMGAQQGAAGFLPDQARFLPLVWTGLRDAGVSLLIGALPLMGLLCFAIRPFGASAQVAWAVLGAWVGGFVAMHVLDGSPESFHLGSMTQVGLVLPLGIWGLMHLALLSEGPRRWGAAMLIALCLVMGVRNEITEHHSKASKPLKIEELARVKDVLRGERFGYYSGLDRAWFLSKHSVASAVLDAPCIRLSAKVFGADEYESFFDAAGPLRFTPKLPDEKPEAWSLRFAKAMNIRYVLDMDTPSKIPGDVQRRLKLVLESPNVKVWEIAETDVAASL